jgi:acyl-coenzyme A thioesterase PaaI-like protein
MTEIRTHEAIDRRLCGEPVEIGADRARLTLTTRPEMAADARGLVHGGFVFGLADHAAMLAINHPHVVLGKAEMRFVAPVVVGEQLVAEAWVGERDGAKIPVRVEVCRAGIPAQGRGGESGGGSGTGSRDGELVASGELVCFTPERHVLDRRRTPETTVRREGHRG